MGCYYFLVNALPPLSFERRPVISYEEVRAFLKENLTPRDWKLVILLQRPVDLRNLRALWLNKPVDIHGNFSQEGLEQAIFSEDLPLFILDFLDRYESIKDRLHYFSAVLGELYRKALLKTEGFLHEYYVFQRHMRLILTALRAKQAGRDLIRELQFENSTDPLVAFLLAQKEGGEAIVPQEYEDLKALFKENSSTPRELLRAILHYQFKKIDEIEVRDPFSIDQILKYLACLVLIEQENQMDKDDGKPILEKLSS